MFSKSATEAPIGRYAFHNWFLSIPQRDIRGVVDSALDTGPFGFWLGSTLFRCNFFGSVTVLSISTGIAISLQIHFVSVQITKSDHIRMFYKQFSPKTYEQTIDNTELINNRVRKDYDNSDRN